ncbi:PadR family transcriptional regulator [Iamia sp. SCSIO 61187]|uniref:PadR family transcriptional regulator n=1 Tax=Iamia sp. SCSIO 61187 TaxID=2722752 RepID=UPI001C635A25|nr:PadR family transcriptional regulator [Iamia sp. SCSIO 61187]QYG91288.1 PadR family transcriptional regulator [Iamia sp. SCSIO 61187]
MGQDLSTTGAAVLSLLTFGDASGYELRTRADATLRFFFAAPAMSQIYAELERLDAAGLVASREMKRPGARPGRVWRLTPKGRRRLARWAAEEPVAPTVFRHHLALRLMLGALVAPSRLQEMVDEHVATVLADRDALQAVLDDLDPDDPATAHAAVVAEWGIATYATELAEMARIRERLAALPSPGAAEGRAAEG